MNTDRPAPADSPADNIADNIAGDDARISCPPEATDSDQAAATIAMTPRQIADLAELLDELDQFLRMSGHAIDALAEFYRTYHDDHHPRFAALCLLDSVSFTALRLRRQAQAASNQADSHDPGADQ